MEEDIQTYLPTVMFRGTPCMMKSTVSPLQTLFKLVWTNVFEKLLEPKTLFRLGTGRHKVRRRYRRFSPKWV